MNEFSRYIDNFSKRVCQGAFYRNIDYFEQTSIEESEDAEQTIIEPGFTEIRKEYAVILNQDCDLDRDFCYRENPPEKEAIAKHDKCLLNLLLCPLYRFESFIAGKHLENINREMQKIGSKEKSKVRKNQNFRYHFFDSKQEYQLPELVADFKHFFSIDRDFFYKNFHKEEYYLCSLNSLFREDLSQRFSYYLARIALPELPQE